MYFTILKLKGAKKVPKENGSAHTFGVPKGR